MNVFTNNHLPEQPALYFLVRIVNYFTFVNYGLNEERGVKNEEE
ncbi:hypothetical protein [Mesobacillus harenae]|nr:hypothetical protein [Mesobacillus harenae]